jgi:hypothetical protein
MKKLLLIGILTILSCSNESKPEKITTYYDNGKIKFEEITSFRSLSSKINKRIEIINSYYPNGNKKVLSNVNSEIEKSSSVILKKERIDSFFRENGKLKIVKKTLNKDLLKFENFDENGQLRVIKDYIIDPKRSVRHKYKSGILYEIDNDYEDWDKGDTIIHPYKLKTFNKYGQTGGTGIVRPLTVEDDSDFFNKNGKLSALEINAYNSSFGKKLINGRINGLFEIIHPDLHPNTKYDLRTGSEQDKTYWSSPQIESEINEEVSRYTLEEFMMFNGIALMYNHELINYLNQTKDDDDKFEVEIDNEISRVIACKDGLMLFDFGPLSIYMDGDYSRLFKSKSFYTNHKEYLSEKKRLPGLSYASYYLEDIKLIEDNLEFRLGNYKDTLSPVVFTYNDLIKSPQGKLIKTNNK